MDSPKMAHTGRRSYRQDCSIARTLDIVGERWTLLVMRELFTGAQTYGQLAEALPGMGTNLLASRLKQLEEDGLIERQSVPGPGKRRNYSLTERGKLLEPILVEMVRFGSRTESGTLDDGYHRPAWSILSSRASFRPDLAGGLNERYEFRVADEVFYLGVRGGRPDNGPGPAGSPVVTTEMSGESFRNVQQGRLKMAQGVWSGEIRLVGGAAAALDRCEQIFGR